MENLRWILLLAGIVFVVVVYVVSRQRRRNREQQSLTLQDDLPEFSATDDLDAVEEGVGQVRIIARFESEAELPGGHGSDIDAATAERDPHGETVVTADGASTVVNANPARTEPVLADTPSDIFTLYILSPSRQEPFTGEQISSAARASGLLFGEMNIFHRLDGADSIQFSLANMLKPGSFDPDKLFDIETTGVTLFMQANRVEDAPAVLDDMLQTGYQMAEMLGGRLCNHRREPLTAQDTSSYRKRMADLMAEA